ncbi:FAD-binding protein [Paraburkholderia sp. Se-20369]|nr:FAD-binding protein [Paraburkholderia sp. Se-20369]
METYDIAVIGAGAAGMMSAAVAGQLGRRVVLIDHAPRLAEKIRISGGGRCNFTNLYAGPDNYLSANPHFARSALARYTPRDFLALLKRHRVTWHEKHKGQLFCDHGSDAVIDMLKNECDAGGIAWRRQDLAQAWQPMAGIDVRCDDEGALSVRSAHLGHDRWHRTDDAARFDAMGRFELTGRRDRVVKLDGKRVSLPEVEARIVAHPFVAQAMATVIDGASRARIGVVAVPSDAGRAALAADGRIAVAAVLRRDLGAYLDPAALPRHWRFRVAMPFDARGKLPVAALAGAFASTPEGFELLAEWRDADQWHAELRVPPDLAHFDGHFPGLPILPGVVQIDWAVRLAMRNIPALRAVRSIDQLKFKAPVPPGAVLMLRLAHDAERRRVRFAFRRGERECTSGTVVYAEPA